MAEFCTCGAQLPPDALFCHKCGKPQRDIIEPEVQSNSFPAGAQSGPVPAEIPPQIPRPQPLPLNFHNPIAVRIAMVAAVCATVLSLLSPTLSWLAAGFFAVYLYCRKTGFRLDVLAGVKIGWITGLILYGFSALVFTVQQLPDALAGHPGKTLLEQVKNSSFQDPAMMQEMTHMIQSDPGTVILLLLAAMFVVVTCLSMAGGALGAKLVGSPNR
ncbi:MAG TPA: zinc ribbon domain-containing protein [Bryobacteraceae bacterium]|jgi:hypothetical protein|nr:zinc ribbon domain-containing protein [Bryobacteraceae bacterium]